MKNKMTLKELAEELSNSSCLNKQESYSDKRMSEVIKPRRIRDYISKKIIKEGVRDGKFKYYNQDHLSDLIQVRKLQSEGLSDNDIKDIMELNDNNKIDFSSNLNQQNNINDLLGSIKNRGSSQNSIVSQLTSQSNISLKSSLYLSKQHIEDPQNEYTTSLKSTVWIEYEINENIILKIKKDHVEQDNKSLLKNIENKLKKIQENKND